MSNQIHEYDKIVKENIQAVIPSLMTNVLGIQAVATEDIADDLQHTKEREPDVLRKITDNLGRTFILHLEFQVADDQEMLYRMLEYFAMLWRKYRIPVRQYVIYMGEKLPKMPTQLHDDSAWYEFHLVPIIGIDYLTFINSDIPEAVIFAILSNFHNEKPENIAKKILQRLEETAKSDLNLKRFRKQLRILAKLRKLQPTIDKIMDSIAHLIDEENDYLYQKATKKAQKQIVIDLLNDTDFSIEKIAKLARISIEQAQAIKEEFEKSKENPK